MSKHKTDSTHKKPIEKRLRSSNRIHSYVHCFFANPGALQATLSQWIADNARWTQNAFNRINVATAAAARCIVRPRFRTSQLRLLAHASLDERFDKSHGDATLIDLPYVVCREDDILAANVTVKKLVNYKYTISIERPHGGSCRQQDILYSLTVKQFFYGCWLAFVVDIKDHCMRYSFQMPPVAERCVSFTQYASQYSSYNHIDIRLKAKQLLQALNNFQQSAPNLFNIREFTQVLIDAVVAESQRVENA